MNGSKPTLLGQYCLLCGLANFALKNSHFTFTNLASTLVAAVGVVVQIQFICVLLQSFCCYCLCFVFCMGHKHVSVFLNCHQMVCRGDMVAMACSYFLFLTQPDWFFFYYLFLPAGRFTFPWPWLRLLQILRRRRRVFLVCQILNLASLSATNPIRSAQPISARLAQNPSMI